MEEQHATAPVLGAFLGMTGRRIEQLCRDGVMVKSGRGKYPVGENTRRLLAHLKAEAGGEDRDVLLEIRKIRLERERLKAQISGGELVPAKAFQSHAECVQRAAEKTFHLLDRTLVNALWPRGIKDRALVDRIISDCDTAFCAWMNAAIEMIGRGATPAQVNAYLFNSHDGPPTGSVRFGESARTKKNREEDDDE